MARCVGLLKALVKCLNRALEWVLNWIERHAVIFTIAGLIVIAALVLKQSDLSHKNCYGLTQLAQINKRFIAQQEAQTQALLAKGITFGIPASELPFLIEQNKQNEAYFLNELHDLAQRNCK